MLTAIAERPSRDKNKHGKRINMAKHLQRDLDSLQKDMLALAGLVEGAVHKSILALQTRDAELAPRSSTATAASTTRRTTSTRSA